MKTIAVRVRPGLVDGPLQGRLLVLLARGGGTEEEPRFLVTGDDASAQVYGMDVEGWGGESRPLVAAEVEGYPLPSVGDLPAAGEVQVQAVLHRYETFRRADGHVVLLPHDRGEGQQWNLAPGNLVSTPRTVRLEDGPLELELDRLLPPIPPVAETRLLRHVELESPSLSRFWGRPMKLGALVLLPEGWDTHPDARYPLVIHHGHFSHDLWGYRDTPADPTLPPVDLECLRRNCPNGHGSACDDCGYPRMVQEMGFAFHQTWTGPDFPRVILVQVEHANPYYDDSYAVNSANVGPYGDAITHELVPHLETTFRGLGPWARGLYGGSTGGWAALAAQVFYPDAYNGAVACCPDPIDFRAFTTIDLYDDENAFHSTGPFRRTPRTAARFDDGRARSTVEQDSRLELALGTRSRSGQQLDIWEAVYSPVGEDGYPRRIFDKRTGVIDRAVAAHWREHHDLSHIIARDWATLGPHLAGKLWIHTGDMDTYFLERGVRRFEERIAALVDPRPDFAITYGHGHGHCWSGDAGHMNFESRLTYHARFIPRLVDRFLKTAPPGVDVKSWRY